MIYFIRAGENGPIKIGSTNKLRRRFDALQTACFEPLKVLKAIEGERARETEIHAKFSELSVHGEWFSPAPELLAFIAAQPALPIDQMGGVLKPKSFDRLPAVSAYLAAYPGGVEKFAKDIGLAVASVLEWTCGGTRWLNPVSLRKIIHATKGALTPNDFFPELDQYRALSAEAAE